MANFIRSTLHTHILDRWILYALFRQVKQMGSGGHCAEFRRSIADVHNFECLSEFGVLEASKCLFTFAKLDFLPFFSR